MNKREIGKSHIIHRLKSCQERVADVEKQGGGTIEQIASARALFENLFELSPDALILVDRRSRIKRINSQAELLFGFSKKDLIGKDHGMLVPDRLKAMHERAMKAYLEEPRTRVMGIGLELRGQRKDGTDFAADIDLGPIEIDGEFLVLAVVRDATKRKGLEDELEDYRQRLEQVVAQRTAEFAKANEALTLEIEERKQAEKGLALRASILDNAREPVFMMNTKGNFVYANKSAINTYGYSLDEFLTMNLSQLLRPDEALVIPDRLKVVQKTGYLSLVTIHVKKDKSLMPVHVNHNLTNTNHGQFIVSMMRNLEDEPEVKLLFKAAPGAVLVTDAKLQVTSCAGTALDQAGLKTENCLGMTLTGFLKGSSFDKILLPAHKKALAGTPVNFSITIERHKYSGWALPIRSSLGEIIGTQSTMLEITEEKLKARRTTTR